MTKEMTIYRTDGTEEKKEFTGQPTLEELQHQVDGYIEYIRLPPGNSHKKMVANEEGQLLGLPVNEKASQIAGQMIVGDVVVY